MSECVKYWQDWQEKNNSIDLELIQNEYIRNCNRYIIDKLTAEGYKDLNGININISREELAKRLISSRVEPEKVRQLIK